MEKKALTTDELNNLPHGILVLLYQQLQDSLQLMVAQTETIQKQNQQLLKQVESLQESIAVLQQNRFGRSSEKNLPIQGQYSLFPDENPVINEAEEVIDKEGMPEEPEFETVVRKKRKRPVGKREADLEGMEVIVEPTCEIPADELEKLFPKGYHRLPDEIYKDLEYVPAHFIVHEHHVAVYAGNHDVGGIVRAPHPKRLLQNSILTPELASGVFNAKYVNQIPINRLKEEFDRCGANISTQVMCGWMIKLVERYLEPFYAALHKEQLSSKLIHCDETPFTVVEKKDNPSAKDPHKHYMWVYHTSDQYGSHPIYVYQYTQGRSHETPKNYLKGYKGILMTDGYQVYHTLEKERPDELKVAGCWAHARRKFAELVKSGNGISASKRRMAEEAVQRINSIYHLDNMYKEASAPERLNYRQTVIRTQTEAYFTWVNEALETKGLDKGSKLYKALIYSHNQEQFLKAFLNDAMIPLDNNDAERSIKKFCVGKHNWHIADTKRGAHASAVLYSIAETAKANGLKPREYFVFLLKGILEHPELEDPNNYLADLMPWSEKVPAEAKKKIKQ